MSSLPPKIEVLLEKIAEAEGLVNFEIVVGSNTKKNVNFLGELFSVVVSGKQIDANGTKTDKKLNLLCKFAPARSLNKGLKTEMMYEREIFFYKNVAPAFNRFQEEMKLPTDDQFTSFPKCYDAVYEPEDDTCVIVMQDLQPEGFALWPNEKPTPFERVRLIVEELAKFHAISFAIKDQRPEQFAEFTKLDDLVRVFLAVDHFERVFRQSIERAMRALRSEEHKSIFRECLRNYRDVCNNCLHGRFSDESCVVTHGDCWKNNVIYRSAANGTAVDICLVDYQFMRYSSPASELLYCIFTSTDKSTRDKHFESLLRIYYDRLATNIRKLGSDPTVLYPYEQLKRELPMCGDFLLLTLPMLTQVALVEARNASEVDDTFDVCIRGAVRPDMLVGLNANAQMEYGKRINDSIGDLERLGCFRNSKK